MDHLVRPGVGHNFWHVWSEQNANSLYQPSYQEQSLDRAKKRLAELKTQSDLPFRTELMERWQKEIESYEKKKKHQ